MSDLFSIVMEADGDEIAPFDPGATDEPAGDIPSEDIAPPATDDAADPGTGGDDDSSPPMMDDIPGFDDSSAEGDTGDSDVSSGDSSGDDEEADQKDEKLSDKANNILNEQLYSRLTKRNDEISDIIDSVKDLVPLLPYEVVKSNDEAMSQLKTALSRGQQYAINDFADAGYGENYLFFQKLNSLYTLLLNRIDTNLKKIKKS